MTSKKNTTSTTNVALVPSPTAGKAAPTKHYPTLDIRSTVSNYLTQEPMTLLVAVPSNTPIPDATNTPVDPTEAFKDISLTSLMPFRISFHQSPMNPKRCFFIWKSSRSSLLTLLLRINQPWPVQINPFFLWKMFLSISSTATLRTIRPTTSRPCISNQISDIRILLSLAVSRSSRTIWLAFYPLLTQVVLISPHTPMISVSHTRWPWTQRIPPQLMSLLQLIQRRRINHPLFLLFPLSNLGKLSLVLTQMEPGSQQ